ncbi:MAG: sigma-54 dependent transcriptional regulator [Kofleriaceae bacterium]
MLFPSRKRFAQCFGSSRKSNRAKTLAFPSAIDEHARGSSSTRFLIVGRQMSSTVLLVDDEKYTIDMLATRLMARGYHVRTASSGVDALEHVRNTDVDVVVTDHQMPDMTGVELCHQLAIRHPDVPTIILTGAATTDVAAWAVRARAYDFLTKPIKVDHLELVLQRAIAHRDVALEVRRLRVGKHDAPIETIIGTSSTMRRTTAMIRRAGPSDANVLIMGESGTGKELVARALHDLSPRKSEPFVAINCGAVPSELLESELFGYVRGAFTDAKSDRAGLFVSAKKGTIFLDEIGEMPLDMQAKLLRVLQERKLRPVGSEEEVEVRARVVAATNRDLEEEVAERRFREDLYHRLNVLPIELPSLHERGSDVLELAQAILARIAKRTRRPMLQLSRSASSKLLDYPWPGNVRELENMMERIAAMHVGTVVEEADLPQKIREHQPSSIQLDLSTPESLVPMEEVILRYTRKVLDSVKGNKTHAARILGIDRRSLYRLLQK